MLPDWVSNPGPLTYESGALPIALPGPACGLERCTEFPITVTSSMSSIQRNLYLSKSTVKNLERPKFVDSEPKARSKTSVKKFEKPKFEVFERRARSKTSNFGF